MPTVSSITGPQPDIVTFDDNFNDPTFPYRLQAQQPIVPPSLNDLILPPNLFNILATMTVVQQNLTQHDDNYCPQSPEPSEPSPISAPPMNLSTIDGWETPHTTTDEQHLLFEGRAQTRTLDLSPGWNLPFGSRTQTNLSAAQSIPAVTTSQDEKQVRNKQVLSKNRGSVAACLRIQRTNNSPNKGHSRTVY